MSEQVQSIPTVYSIAPIGAVRRTDEGIQLHILPDYRPALKALESFSHLIVLWWAGGCDTAELRGNLQCYPPYAPDVLTGVFATRAPYRPNPIAITTCKILSVDEANGIIRIADIDALDETEILDLKAYYPVCDRVREAHIPAWLEGWPEWMPDEGLGL
jgi:tRNA (adenine37-N6)-methyltransferase